MDLWNAGALGMVETRGLAASIVAVDVMTKAAEVTVIGVSRIGDGLVTVSFIGDMASVTAAVDSARRAVAATGGTIAATVVGRPAVPAHLVRDTPPTGRHPRAAEGPDDAGPEPEATRVEDRPDPVGESTVEGDRPASPAPGGSPKRRSARSTAPKRRPPPPTPPIERGE
ncbi:MULTISPECIES: BMC domain-containing protein [unclassified Micromonospora]|uniref:BMC domain-containing protein n=1 Tax=unclassified Micromonospora TaxID=2617518 RepID=UPI0020CA3C90|nr:BMC domain-containing protein [Verrucosispora sp. NA02020]